MCETYAHSVPVGVHAEARTGPWVASSITPHFIALRSAGSPVSLGQRASQFSGSAGLRLQCWLCTHSLFGSFCGCPGVKLRSHICRASALTPCPCVTPQGVLSLVCTPTVAPVLGHSVHIWLFDKLHIIASCPLPVMCSQYCEPHLLS